MTENKHDMQAAALWYAGKGNPVFPCKPRSKEPLTPHGFKDATTDLARIRAWWKESPDANIGLPTGAVSGLLVLDIDPRNGGDQSLSDLTAKFGPLPETAIQMTGGGGRHIIFRHPGVPVPKTLANGIDLKGDGGYIVVAPSVHPSGIAYQWDGVAGANGLLIPREVPRWLLEQIEAGRNGARVESKRGDGEKWGVGQRNNRLASVAGTMRRRGLSQEAIEVALLAENSQRCDPPLSETEVRRIAASVASYNPADEFQHQTVHGHSDEWPEPLPIQAELPPVEAFSEDLLPTSFRPLALDVSERMQVPLDYPAVAMVLCLAGVVNRRATIQPKEHDTGWLVVPNLWGGIIAPPGFLKSPVIQAATRPLNQIQTQWLQEHDEAQRDFGRAKEEFELKRAAWKEQYKAKTKLGKTPPERPEDEPEEPRLRRLIVNDATFEAMHQTMNENPAGSFVIRDELTGWWSTLDRAGREGERAFCLQAWNGDTSFTLDRIGRGTIHVEACCMSMLGGIQPGRLRSYLMDALKDGPSNDGLIQRFQVLVWPDTGLEWKYVDRAPSATSEEQAARIFRKLVDFDPENPVRLRFAPEAQELFVVWLADLEVKIRSSEFHPALVSHLSKYRKLMPALAVLFELADWAAGEGSLEFVSLDHTKQAAAWCDYLESHARRVYSCVSTPQLRAGRELADKIKRRKVGTDGNFSCRDVYLKGWSGLDTAEAVKLAVEVLEDAEWVRAMGNESRQFGGRPSNRYEVNPRVWQ